MTGQALLQRMQLLGGLRNSASCSPTGTSSEKVCSSRGSSQLIAAARVRGLRGCSSAQ